MNENSEWYKLEKGRDPTFLEFIRRRLTSVDIPFRTHTDRKIPVLRGKPYTTVLVPNEPDTIKKAYDAIDPL